MKALTLIQPWAQLMADGRKEYETRHWRPWQLASGEPFAITASKRLSAEDAVDARLFGYEPEDLPRGCVVAVVRYRAAHPTDNLFVSDEERSYGDYSSGRFAWHCTDVFKLPEPLPCTGKQGIWTLPDEITRSIASLMVQEAARKSGLTA